MSRRLRCRMVVGSLAAVLAVPLLARLLENDLIFWPEKSLVGDPASVGLAYEDVALEVASGANIKGWLIPHPHPKAVCLYLEGNGGNRSTRLGHIAMLYDMGCTVAIFDYEGYADSQGRHSEETVYRDARAEREWLEQDERTKNVPLVLMGESLGGAVAIYLASLKAPAALIVDHSFTTMSAVIDRVCCGLPMHLLFQSRYDSIARIRRYHGPVLVIHGEEDRLIPIAQGRMLYQAAPGPKRFLAIPGCGHDQKDVLRVGGARYRDAIQRFIDGAVSGYPAIAPS